MTKEYAVFPSGTLTPFVCPTFSYRDWWHTDFSPDDILLMTRYQKVHYLSFEVQHQFRQLAENYIIIMQKCVDYSKSIYALYARRWDQFLRQHIISSGSSTAQLACIGSINNLLKSLGVARGRADIGTDIVVNSARFENDPCRLIQQAKVIMRLKRVSFPRCRTASRANQARSYVKKALEVTEGLYFVKKRSTVRMQGEIMHVEKYRLVLNRFKNAVNT